MSFNEYTPGVKSEGEIVKAVEKVFAEDAFRQAAKKVSASFKQSGGVTEAVEFIEGVGADKGGHWEVIE